MQDHDRDSTGSQHDSLTTGSLQNYDKIRARSVQRLRAAAEILQDLDNICAEMQQRFGRLQDYYKIHAESRQSRDPAPSPAETTPNRRGSEGAKPVERAPLPQAMRHCCSAHSGRPTARRSPKGAGAAWAWSWDLSPEPEEAEGRRRRMDQHPYSGRRPGRRAKRALFVLRVELVLGFVSPRFCARRRRIWAKHLLVQQRGGIVNW
ncbi:hypothetical protein JOF45_002527 [Nesterenkonia lacusekhoensis]|uniref:Uncharacterized protein n=1 Tax=Nesterenkonia lacusekhoensis TaxID=150832 RepID=A0ABS4T6L8_9MICC|nr:hypothetical protein [Nesterenkonia lacusekhoensis]